MAGPAARTAALGTHKQTCHGSESGCVASPTGLRGRRVHAPPTLGRTEAMNWGITSASTSLTLPTMAACFTFCFFLAFASAFDFLLLTFLRFGWRLDLDGVTRCRPAPAGPLHGSVASWPGSHAWPPPRRGPRRPSLLRAHAHTHARVSSCASTRHVVACAGVQDCRAGQSAGHP